MALMQLNFRSRLLRTAAEVTVFLPLKIPAGSEMTVFPRGGAYQTLWLLHGGLGDSRDFVKYSGVLRYAEENRVALVLPNCPGKFYEEPWFGFVTRELPGLLGNLLPLSPRREDNFIGGLSHGGDCALRAALEYPGQYGGALVMSAAGTTHFVDGRENHLLFDIPGLASRNLASGGPLPKLLFATGTGDRGFPHYTPVIDRLEALGLPVTRRYAQDDGHSWPFWDETLRQALAELLPLKRSLVFPET